jgi:phosphopantothenate synthetase
MNRKATEYCSFCGEHKDDVPLIITSQLNPQSACCSTCALTIVDQTFRWASGIFRTARAEVDRQESAKQRIVTGDSVDAAIKKAGD